PAATPLPNPPRSQVGPARFAHDDAELGQARVPGGREHTVRVGRSALIEAESGVAATAHALEKLLREGRPEFAEKPWVPHRPPRPEKTEGGQRFVISSDFEPKGDQPQAIDELVE